MSSTTVTARSSVPSPSPKKFYKGDYTNGALPPGNTSPWQRGPTQGHRRRFNKKVPKSNSGKPFHQSHHKQQNNFDYPDHDVLLHRLSQPSSPASGTLLERIGGSVEDEAASTLSNSDWIDEDRVAGALEEGAEIHSNLPLFSTPHFYTPEPGEVERFLESVIGAPPTAPTPSGSAHACSVCCPYLVYNTPFFYLRPLRFHQGG